MHEFIKYLPVLKLGTTRYNYPIYGSFLHSDGKSLSTNEGKVHVNVECPAPFKGDVNLFVLEGFLRKVGEDLNIEQEGRKLLLTKGNFSTTLQVQELPFPKVEIALNKTLEVTTSLLETIKQALKYISSSDPVLSYVFVGEDRVVASDKARIFYKRIDLTGSSSVGIDKKMFALLHGNCRVGLDKSNTVITFDKGHAIFLVTPISEYPIDKVSTYVERSQKDLGFIAPIDRLKEATERIMPIFFGEGETFVTLTNDEITASSAVNGIASEKIDSILREEFSININVSFFNQIPSGYGVYINPKIPDKLVLMNDLEVEDDTKIILMGGK